MSKWLIPACVVAVLAGLLLFIPPHHEPQSSVHEPLQDATQIVPAAPMRPQPEQPLDDFLNEASLAVVLRFPETITSLGINGMIGIRDDELMPATRSYELETIALLDSLLDELALYDLNAVDPSDALSAKIYGWYLENLRESLRLSAHDYLISNYITSFPSVLERFLTRSHPVRTRANAQDYLSRLEQVAPRFDELIVRLAASEAIGTIPSQSILLKAIASIQQMAEAHPEETSYYTSFSEKLSQAASIPAPEKLDFEEQAAAIIESSVLPGYQRLADFLALQADRADESIGVWRHEGGDEYYAHRLRTYTTTNLTADEIHELGIAEVSRLRGEIIEALAKLGVDSQSDLQLAFEQLRLETGFVTGQDTVEACQGLIDDIEQLVRPAFASWPSINIVVVEGETSAFFSPGTLDGSRPGRFYAPAAREEPLFGLPTLTYHEAIPGHGLQGSFAYAADIPIYRAGLGFSGYSEGWALYAERLVWELGGYEEDAYGNIGRLQAELFRAVRLVVDTGIHAKRWTFDEALTFLMDNTGLDEEFAIQEVERYVVLPGQATSYKIGMLTLLDLRERAQRELGDAFDLPGFHQVVLEEGDVPLLILEELVDAYITRGR